MPVSLGVGAIDLGHEVADEGLLVERREVGAQEVVASAEETVMIDLAFVRHAGVESVMQAVAFEINILGYTIIEWIITEIIAI